MDAVDTSQCTLRYLRVAGAAVWGADESSWQDLRSIPAEGSGIALDAFLNRESYRVHTSAQSGEGGGTAGLPHSLIVVTRIHANKMKSLEHVGLVAVVSLVLLLSCMLLGKDIDVLVIAPLETMSRMVKQLSDNPMAKVKSETVAGLGSCEGETRMIASALIKLSSMLQIGFGEAGASIIGMNLDNSTHVIQPIVPGRRMMGLFGFCDVRNFTNATECLQEDIMVYINCIAEYCHNAVSDNCGFPNKNVGDAFLMAWPLTDGAWTTQAPGQQTTVQDLAESALRAFLRVILETSCSHVLRRLSLTPELQKRIPGFRTELGFGLHVGWAIEGAIGTAEKVDPSYLSPNVELSMKLEAGTKYYGVCILMSDSFYDVLPPKVQRLCRFVDRVQEPGSRAPIDLYTYDFHSFDLHNGKMPLVQGKPAKSFWEQFPPATSATFRSSFAKAVRHYTDGDWYEAKEELEGCLQLEPGDVPSRRLCEFMGHYQFESPPNWKGFREVSGESFEIYQPQDKKLSSSSTGYVARRYTLARQASASLCRARLALLWFPCQPCFSPGLDGARVLQQRRHAIGC